MYKPLAATTAWNNCSLKFCGRSFHQDGDPKHCSCALSTLTPREEQRVLASECFPLPVLRPQLQKHGKGKVSCEIRRSSRGCYYFGWRVLFFSPQYSDSIYNKVKDKLPNFFVKLNSSPQTPQSPPSSQYFILFYYSKHQHLLGIKPALKKIKRTIKLTQEQIKAIKSLMNSTNFS